MMSIFALKENDMNWWTIYMWTRLDAKGVCLSLTIDDAKKLSDALLIFVKERGK